MSILHQVQHSQAEGNALACCLTYIGAEDEILLVGNGVNAVLHQQESKQLAAQNVLLLEDDVIARGLVDLCNDFQLITYAQFVALTLKHDKVISW